MFETFRAWGCTRTVSVAVAGLSRSGKTLSFTSLVANLLAAARNSRGAECLAGLEVIAEKRLRAAGLPKDDRASRGKKLPYDELLGALTRSSPAWPSRTADREAAMVRVWGTVQELSLPNRPEGKERRRHGKARSGGVAESPARGP
ncbi:MAG: YcjX family protein [Elioraea sp.]|nr:YcjX family protein [Elioraea sp.]